MVQEGRLEFDVLSSIELDAVVRLAAAVTGARAAVLTVQDELGSCQLATAGPADPRRYVAAEESLACATVLAGARFTSEDLTVDDRLGRTAWAVGELDPIRGYAAVPVLVEGELVGLLGVLDDRARPFTADMLRDLTDLATVVEAQLVARREARMAEELTVGLHGVSLELASSQAFSRALLEALPVGVIACDAAGRPTVFNRVTREWHGTMPDPSQDAASAYATYRLYRADGVTPLPREHNALATALREGSVHDHEMVIGRPDEAQRIVLCSGSTVADDAGTVLGAVVVMSDVTERKRLERELQQAATHDALTGLPNRRLLVDRLEHTMGAAARSGAPVTLLYCDLDGFKAVNDQYGHAAGDEVLVAVAERLGRAVRPGDTVARLGGDEFVLLCPGLDHIDARSVTERVERIVSEPIDSVLGHPLHVGVSIGSASSRDGQDAAALMADADVEMFRIKEQHHSRR